MTPYQLARIHEKGSAIFNQTYRDDISGKIFIGLENGRLKEVTGQLQTEDDLTNINTVIDVLSSGANLVLVDSIDTTPDYLYSKIIAGTNITFTVQNPGANESILIDAAGGTTTPAGLNTWVQYNNSGVFGADAGFIRDVASQGTTITCDTGLGDITTYQQSPLAFDMQCNTALGVLSYFNIDNNQSALYYTSSTQYAGIDADNTDLSIYNKYIQWKWPTTDGAAGSLLSSDGAGNLSFISGTGLFGTPGTVAFYDSIGNLTSNAQQIQWDEVNRNFYVGDLVLFSGGNDTSFGVEDQLRQIFLDADDIYFGSINNGNVTIKPLIGAGTRMVVTGAGGTLSAQAIPTATTPGGSTTEIQYNLAGVFTGDPNFIRDPATQTFSSISDNTAGSISTFIESPTDIVFNVNDSPTSNASALTIAPALIQFNTSDGVSFSYSNWDVVFGTSLSYLGTVNTSGIIADNTNLSIINYGITWLWPVVDGTAKNALITNGAGVLSFSAVPSIVAHAEITNKTSNQTVLTYTPLVQGTYRISCWSIINSTTATTLTLTITYTNLHGASLTKNINLTEGTTVSPAVAATYKYSDFTIRIDSSLANIVISAVITGATINYDAEANIEFIV